MKKAAFIFILLYILVYPSYAQEPRFIFDADSTDTAVRPVPQDDTFNRPAATPAVVDTAMLDSLSRVPPAIPSWKIDPRFGERIPVPMDTIFKGYHQRALVDGQGVAVGYLGNWGSPAQSKIFFEREEPSEFSFLDPFNYYYKRPQDHIFLDTKKPYSNFSYWSGGGRRNKEERFTAEMSLSFNKKFSLGFDIDYVYARGNYQSLANKQINYSIFSSYRTDQYQMHIFVANNNYTNTENGGLKSLSSDFFDENAENLPVRIFDTWNNMRGRRLYMTHKYSIGYDNEESEEFIPVASVILTSNYADQRRSFTSNQVQLLDDSLYNYINRDGFSPENDKPIVNPGSGSGTESLSVLDDRMSYYSFKNTLGISLNEGFRPWVKFGLTAFIEQDMRKYTLPDVLFPALATNAYSQNSTVIGGVLSKRKGEFLRYNLSADLGVLGYNIGEFRLEGDVTTQFKLFNKDFLVRANAYIKNLKPKFYETDFVSRYYRWTSSESDFQTWKGMNYKADYRNLDDIRRVYVGGEIYIPFTKTRISGGVENITNYIYYTKRPDSLSIDGRVLQNYPVERNQFGDNIQVFSLRLDQNLKAGIFHWDNQIVFQHTNHKYLLPLPKLSVYSNIYIQTRIAKVLSMQLGVDAHFYSRYTAPGYDPALMRFYNQTERKIGNFPMATAYANFHLKRTRFFVMMYNVGRNISDEPYYSVNDYLLNPMMFKFGLSWNFTD